MLHKVVIAGVPEQVNIPLKICRERGIFKKYNVDVQFREVPEGTGKMLQLLENGEVDVAITVTDAFIAGRAQGRPLQLCGTWVTSPLVWAIAGKPSAEKNTIPLTFQDLLDARLSTPAQTQEQHDEELHHDITSTTAARPSIPPPQPINGRMRFGVSRLGSGSHTMAHYAAMLHGVGGTTTATTTDGGTPGGIVKEKEYSALDFTVANNFQGLREGVRNNDFDAFLWEVFTTKPFFDNNELAYLGEVATPWPAFSFVCREANPTAAGVDVMPTPARWNAIKHGLFPALQEGAALFLREATATSATSTATPTNHMNSPYEVDIGGGCCIAMSGDGNSNTNSRRSSSSDIRDQDQYQDQDQDQDMGDSNGISVQRIMDECRHTRDDAVAWISKCRYATDAGMTVNVQQLSDSVAILKKVGLVPAGFDTERLWRNEDGVVNDTISLDSNCQL